MTVGYLHIKRRNGRKAALTGRTQLFLQSCFLQRTFLFKAGVPFFFGAPAIPLKPHGGPDLRESSAHPDISIIAFQGQLAAAGKRGVYLFEYKPQLAPLRARTLGGRRGSELKMLSAAPAHFSYTNVPRVRAPCSAL